MKSFKKFIAAAVMVAALTVTLNIGSCKFVSRDAYAKEYDSNCLFDLDLSEYEIGQTQTDGKYLNGSTSTGFKVIEVDESISESGKALSNTSGGDEIYYNLFNNNKISFTDVQENTHYLVTVKVCRPYRAASETSSVLKLVMFDKSSTGNSGRLSFFGLQYNSLKYFFGFYGPGSNQWASTVNEMDKWYVMAFDYYASTDSTQNYIYSNFYPVEKSFPSVWECKAGSSAIAPGSSAGFNTNSDAYRIGMKGYSGNIQFTDLKCYKYTDDEMAAFNSLQEGAAELSENVKSGALTLEEAKNKLIEYDEIINGFNGNLKDLANGALTEANALINDTDSVIEEAKGIIDEVNRSTIDKSNVFDFYNKLDEAKEKLGKSYFVSDAQFYIEKIDEIENEKLAPVLTQFNVWDDFNYTNGKIDDVSGADLTHGWSEGWKTQTGSVMIESNKVKLTDISSATRKLAQSLSLYNSNDCLISWKMTLGDMNEAGISVGSLFAGIKGLYPSIGYNMSAEQIDPSCEYEYILKISKEEEGATLSMRVIGPEYIYKQKYDVSSFEEGLENINSIGISSCDEGGKSASLSDLKIQLTQRNYGSKAEKAALDFYNAAKGGEVKADELIAFEENAANELKTLSDGITKDYITKIYKEAFNTYIGKLANFYDEQLKKSFTYDNYLLFKSVVEKVTDKADKETYEAKLKDYTAKISVETPIIESIGIEGKPSAGNTLKAKISVYDPVGIGDSISYVWHLDSEICSNGESCTVPSNAGGKQIYVEAVPKNIFGYKGEKKASSKITISGGSSPKGGGGGGGVYYNNNKVIEPTVPVAPDEPEKPQFSDIQNHWAKDYIMRLFENEIVNGETSTLFVPDGDVTRAEFVKMIVSAIGLNMTSYSGKYADVKANDWFSDYLETASNKGIVSGYDSIFRPNDKITREECVKILIEGYKIKTGNQVTENADISFNDESEIEAWALPYVKSAVKLGFVNGYDKNIFMPKGFATRGAASAMICRMLDNIK